jgi:hypothetical protein
MPRLRKRARRLIDAYAFPGFRPRARVRGVFGDPKARIVTLVRRSKKRAAVSADARIGVGTTDAHASFAICPENKVSLGFVEGLNNKIRVIQRRAYGLRDEEYLRLKILTCMLPPL